jgi:hypothetical protein
MKKIIGYFHICQKDRWKFSFDMIFNYVKNYGLYDITSEVRIGIVNDDGNILDDYRLHNSKFKIIFIGNSALYERPTLLHMRNSCAIDGENTSYWYLHTKGLRHFSTERENYVIDWIKLMLYWNIKKWNIALEKLEHHNTYGCNMLGEVFYSGNFWWANSRHVALLPTEIEDYYTAPEDWILRVKDYCQIFSSGIQGEGHYNFLYPESNYLMSDDVNRILPLEFYIDTYKMYHYDKSKTSNEEYLNDYFVNGVHTGINYSRDAIHNIFMVRLPKHFDIQFYKEHNSLNNYSDEEVIVHWFTIGISEKRQFNINIIIPQDFDYNFYRNKNDDLKELSNNELLEHWINFGKDEGRKYNLGYNIPDEFDCDFYKNRYSDLKNLSDEELVLHWINYGDEEGRIYKFDSSIPDDFNFEFYRNKYQDLKDLTNKQLLSHWINHGDEEGRLYKFDSRIPDDFNIEFYKNRHDDLKSLTNKELISHWINFGKKEGRVYNLNNSVPKDFNPEAYKNNYNDLKNLSNEDLILHWINFGKKEGRFYK